MIVLWVHSCSSPATVVMAVAGLLSSNVPIVVCGSQFENIYPIDLWHTAENQKFYGSFINLEKMIS